MAGGEPLIPAELAPHHHAHDSHAHPPPHGAAAAAGSSAPSPPSHSRPSVQSESIGDLSGSVLSLRAGASAAGKGKKATGWRARLGLAGVARRTLGIVLLLVTVFMWTASNFLASYIFSDHTYDKPFFVVYINTSAFAVSLIPVLVRHARKHGVAHLQSSIRAIWDHRYRTHTRLKGEEEAGSGTNRVDGSDETLPLAADRDDHDDERAREGTSGRGDGGVTERLLVDDEATLMEGNAGASDAALADLGNSALMENGGLVDPAEEKLSLGETARLSLEFCMLWFLANYLASAPLAYTSVGSVTILTSTSSVWTLIFCALMRVEGFTIRKLAGVLASLAGIVLISSVDLSGKSDENRGNFPHKSQMQILIGDGMAFASAIIYGLYVTVMKLRVGNEDRVSMPLFFGLVGLFNVFFLWPGFIILHYTGIETFELPPSGKVWLIVLFNSVSSLLSDMSWAYAMLLTTPLVVTVGLSMTIPLSLIGEMVQYAQYSSAMYWIGAGIVFISFLFINHESHEEGEKAERPSEAATEMA